MSKRKTFLQFLLTKNGQTFLLGGTFCVGATLFSINYFPHTFFINRYKNVMQAYKAGIEIPVSEKLTGRIRKAMDILDLPKYEKKIVKSFTVVGFDLQSIGSLKSKFGTYIGLPRNYSYNTKDDIERQEILVRNEPIKWSSTEGKLLADAIVLTEDEQIFGITRSLLQASSQSVLFSSIYPMACVLASYFTGTTMNQRMNLYVRPLSMRLMLYTLNGLFFYGIYAFAQDFTQVSYDIAVDKRLCEQGEEFIKSGISFYDKQLKKNIALRHMTGDNIYTAKGNLNYVLRNKTLPLTSSKQYFEMQLDEIRKAKSSLGDIKDDNINGKVQAYQ